MLGPALLLVAVFVMRATGHRTGWLLYPGLVLMVAVSIGDLLALARVCATRASCGDQPV